MCKAEEFWGLSAEQLVRLLRSEELRIEEEYQVFTAAMAWLHQDVGRRRKHVVEVLGPVRFPLLSPQRLLKYIDGEGGGREEGGGVRGQRSEVRGQGYRNAGVAFRSGAHRIVCVKVKISHTLPCQKQR